MDISFKKTLQRRLFVRAHNATLDASTEGTAASEFACINIQHRRFCEEIKVTIVNRSFIVSEELGGGDVDTYPHHVKA
jgi:hypothetical protein